MDAYNDGLAHLETVQKGTTHLLASVLEQALDMQCWCNLLHFHKSPYIFLGHCRPLGLTTGKDNDKYIFKKGMLLGVKQPNLSQALVTIKML